MRRLVLLLGFPKMPGLKLEITLALWFTAGIAAAQPGEVPCHVTTRESKRTVPWAGNSGEIQWAANRPDCSMELPNTPWLTISVLPPGTIGSQRILRYSIDTNLSPAQRTGTIHLGDIAITIEQEAGPQPGMAYSPGRLEFRYPPVNNSPDQRTKNLFVGSDEPMVFSARLAEPAEWLKIQPAASQAARKQQTFQVTVQAERLPPGTYRTSIQIEAPGAANPREVIPVTLVVAAPEAKPEAKDKP